MTMTKLLRLVTLVALIACIASSDLISQSFIKLQHLQDNDLIAPCHIHNTTIRHDSATSRQVKFNSRKDHCIKLNCPSLTIPDGR